jgi:chemotaxis protein methyltransferase CheR
MSPSEQSLLGAFIEREFGVQMPPSKRSLLQSRLAKRLQALGSASYREYFDFVVSNRGQDEFLIFTDLVTTHETSFFREEKHFQVLSDTILPRWQPTDDQGTRGTLNALCAACSSGEEVYTLAMVLDEALEHRPPGFGSFIVEGLDLSERMVDQARRGVYTAERVKRVPPVLQNRYFMRHKDVKKTLRRVVPELRARTVFHQGNLLADPQTLQARYELIFCRNVLIYFNKENQQRVVKLLISRLAPGGYLFLGHSETMAGTLSGLPSPFHSVYRRPA